jgi:hypothetical protein
MLWFHRMEQKFGSDVHGLGAPPSQAPPPAKPRKSIKDKLIATKDRMAASLSTLASGPPQERPQSLGAKLATVGRRVTQVALEKMGRAEASDDSEFEACKVMLADLKTYHTSLKLHLQEYLNSVGGMWTLTLRPDCVATLCELRGNFRRNFVYHSIICCVFDGWRGFSRLDGRSRSCVGHTAGKFLTSCHSHQQ